MTDSAKIRQALRESRPKYEVMQTVRRTARSSKVCHYCNGLIEKGSDYIFQRFKCDDVFGSFVVHLFPHQCKYEEGD